MSNYRKDKWQGKFTRKTWYFMCARKSLFFTSFYLQCNKMANKHQQKYAHLQINLNTFFIHIFS